jgi:hypothetical protein
MKRKVKVVRASNRSWKGDHYLSFEGKTKNFRPIVAMSSHESGPILPRLDEHGIVRVDGEKEVQARTCSSTRSSGLTALHGA